MEILPIIMFKKFLMFIDNHTISFVIVVGLIITNAYTISLLNNVEDSCSKLMNHNKQLIEDNVRAKEYIKDLEYTLELCDVNMDDTVGCGDAYSAYYGI